MRSAVPAALASGRVICPYEVDGVRMNLAQLMFALSNAIGHADAAGSMFMTEDRVVLGLVVPFPVALGAAVEWRPATWTFPRFIRMDGVSVVDAEPLST